MYTSWAMTRNPNPNPNPKPHIRPNLNTEIKSRLFELIKNNWRESYVNIPKLVPVPVDSVPLSYFAVVNLDPNFNRNQN